MLEFEIYPKEKEGEPTPLFTIEFSHYEDKTLWRLFKKNIMNGREMHPWQLAGGKVLENVISMNTRKFLEFMVDSLNSYAEIKNKELENGLSSSV